MFILVLDKCMYFYNCTGNSLFNEIQEKNISNYWKTYDMQILTNYKFSTNIKKNKKKVNFMKHNLLKISKKEK